jgi:hypothetical protein
VTTMVEVHQLLCGRGGINNVPLNKNFIQTRPTATTAPVHDTSVVMRWDVEACKTTHDCPWRCIVVVVGVPEEDHQPCLPCERT